MLRALKLHPSSLCSSVTRIEVEVARPRAGSLVLSYVVTGNIGDLCMPPEAAPVRTDELWRRTCFEAFVGPAVGREYCEFNFSPSTQWAAYQFDGHRRGMRVANDVASPAIEVHSSPGRFTLQARLGLEQLACLPRDAAWRLGLSAVIEDTSGRQSYWALTHPPGKADFHHSDCFALELPPA